MRKIPDGTRVTPRLRAACVAILIAATSGTTIAGSPAYAAPSRDTTQFKGVNWADPRDNFADDPVALSGLSTSDGYAQTYAKASRIISAFRANLGANTVRLPINPYTVNGSYWKSYRGVIDAASAHGFKVIVSYWEGTGSRKDGFIDDPATFWPMWNTVVKAYKNDRQVYFEPMNEPHGYTDTEWADIAAQWLATYPSVPRDRVFVSGAGYNDHVTSVCADPRLTGTYLSLHHYGFWKDYATYDQWVSDLKERIGDCAGRTVADEFGAPMTTGLDYNVATPSNNFINYVQAVTDTFRELKMGSVYWPGLRTDDTYSLQTLTGDPARPWLATTNQSGADRLAWGWGRGKPVRP
ncbi:cellulase [Streptomyces avermitilis]|uniref:Cellulase n=1 Tax=Streptomyces avermitilis TaxID=33903 RepID=A0A4D4M7Y1_STRAX|nr:cellulase family glycosylhydrolase [Streptomyces avermitilis]OOV18058.1 cellulase [Streptomyces avermitilis]BBJ56059.1 cellulase [Streptomyces avermitilis]GDY68002.1 cellulase [Streptomyces avermitilis]GDY71667.1 cellulase [Streptomyces avermitilis]